MEYVEACRCLVCLAWASRCRCDASYIGAQIASALAEAHGQGIVHRDLKPENILLSEKRGESDVVKVVDFGIAKMVAHVAPGKTRSRAWGTVFGTPHYIAPEQASGQSVDGRADIYSLGCILFPDGDGQGAFRRSAGSAGAAATGPRSGAGSAQPQSRASRMAWLS